MKKLSRKHPHAQVRGDLYSRSRLKEFHDSVKTYSARFVRYGVCADGETTLLSNVQMDGQLMAAHIWIKKNMMETKLHRKLRGGDLLFFEASVAEYQRQSGSKSFGFINIRMKKIQANNGELILFP